MLTKRRCAQRGLSVSLSLSLSLSVHAPLCVPLVRIKLQAYAADILDRNRTDAERINRSTKHDYDVIINEKVRTGRCQRGLNKDNEIDLISKSYLNWAVCNAYCVLYRTQK